MQARKVVGSIVTGGLGIRTQLHITVGTIIQSTSSSGKSSHAGRWWG